MRVSVRSAYSRAPLRLVRYPHALVTSVAQRGLRHNPLRFYRPGLLPRAFHTKRPIGPKCGSANCQPVSAITLPAAAYATFSRSSQDSHAPCRAWRRSSARSATGYSRV
jgi:hypothetical protein